MSSCKARAIAFCGFGTTRSWQNLDGVHQTIARELGRITPTQTLLLEPSPSMGEGWVGVMLPAAQVA